MRKHPGEVKKNEILPHPNPLLLGEGEEKEPLLKGEREVRNPLLKEREVNKRGTA